MLFDADGGGGRLGPPDDGYGDPDSCTANNHKAAASLPEARFPLYDFLASM